MRIVGFGYHVGSGRKILARLIAEELAHLDGSIRARTVGFADKPQDYAYRLFHNFGLEPAGAYAGDDPAQLLIEKLGKTVQQIWDELYEAIRERFGPDIWFQKTFQEPDCDILLIRDVENIRQLNAIKDLGGACIAVDDGEERELHPLDKIGEFNLRVRSDDIDELSKTAKTVARSLALNAALK